MKNTCEQIIETIGTLENKGILAGKIYVDDLNMNFYVDEQDVFNTTMDAIIPRSEWALVGNCYMGAEQLHGYIITSFVKDGETFTLLTLSESGVFSYHLLDEETFEQFENKYDTIYTDFHAVYGLKKACFESREHYDYLVEQAKDAALLAMADE